MKTCAVELGKQLEQRASQVCVAEFKYLHLYNEAQILKKRLATDVSFYGAKEQRLITTINDGLEYVDAFHRKAVEFQTTAIASICGSLSLFF